MKRRKAKFSKEAFKKSRGKCFFCDENRYYLLDVHRIIPGETGGKYHAENCMVLCKNCHGILTFTDQIVIDKKYQQMTSPLFKIHYWIDGIEYWKDETLGHSFKIAKKRKKKENGTT